MPHSLSVSEGLFFYWSCRWRHCRVVFFPFWEAALWLPLFKSLEHRALGSFVAALTHNQTCSNSRQVEWREYIGRGRPELHPFTLNYWCMFSPPPGPSWSPQLLPATWSHIVARRCVTNTFVTDRSLSVRAPAKQHPLFGKLYGDPLTLCFSPRRMRPVIVSFIYVPTVQRKALRTVWNLFCHTANLIYS